MRLVDANLLIYAQVTELPQHAAARAWLENQLNGPTRIALPWPSLLGYMRIVTNARLFPRPLTIDRAWNCVSEWLSLPQVWIPLPTERHAETLGGLLAESHAQGNLVLDAHLAALAIEHGLILCSSDSDFAIFPSLKWEDPLRDAA